MTSTPRARTSARLVTIAASFAAGMTAMAILLWGFGPTGVSGAPRQTQPSVNSRPRSTVSPPTTPASGSSHNRYEALIPDPMADLRQRQLEVPVQGVGAHDLRDTFHDRRDQTREHEALDILAPRNTPVVAVEDGTIAKLFFSKAGGITIYQFDPSERFAYYYAHLDRYAPQLNAGDHVRRGQVIGYVGTTGNAPKDTPHLHFAVFELTPEKHWWQGKALDPFDIF